MADNPLKAVVDAIAESDNEIAGTLVTRLREAHRHGRDDGYTDSGAPDYLSSPVDTFVPGDVGKELDILSPAAIRGRYLATTPQVQQSIRLTTLAGGAVSFTTQVSVVWRWATLRVETVYGFMVPGGVIDPRGRLWVGSEPAVVTYGSVTQAASASKFNQLGDPVTGLGYLTELQREDSEVVDANRIYSSMDRLRRAMLVAYATADELDRIGRNLGLPRPLGFDDATYRRLLQVVPYIPRGTVFALELLLEALYPNTAIATVRGWIVEIPMQKPNTVILTLPDTEPSLSAAGRALLGSAGPIPHVTEGRWGTERAQSTTTTAVAVSHGVTTPVGVFLRPVARTLDMEVLPSSAGWTFVNEGNIEADCFSSLSQPGGKLLVESQTPGTAQGGRYKYAVGTLALDQMEIDVWWRLDADTLVGGRPWQVWLCDGSREFCLLWHKTSVALGQRNGTVIGGAIVAFAVGAWHHFRLALRGGWIFAGLDGVDLFGPVDPALFAAFAGTEAGFGYTNNGANQQWICSWDNLSLSWSTDRNHCNCRHADGVLAGGGAVTLTSATAHFATSDGPTVPGAHDGRLIRVSPVAPVFPFYYRTDGRNCGLWRIAIRNSSGSVDLEGVIHSGEATVSGKNGDLPDGAARLGAYNGALVRTLAPSFVPADGPSAPGAGDGKWIDLSGGSAPNTGSFEVLEYLDPWCVRVDHAAPGFTSQSGLTWAWSPGHFQAATAVGYEVIGVATATGPGLTLRDALPGAATDVDVWYEAVASAQLLRDEFVVNAGSGAFWPFYLLDIEQAKKDLIESILAAGVIPEYLPTY